MLLFSAALAATAHGQTLPSPPSTDSVPSGGIQVGTGPDGVNLGIDGGDTGGVNVGAGPGGVGLDLRTGPKATTPTPTTGGSGSGPNSSADTPGAASPGESAPDSGRDARPGSPARDGAGGDYRRAGTGGGADRGAAAGGTPSVDGRRTAADADRNSERGGVPPFFDLIDRIPTAVRAGLLALALIALLMWGLWVRGRRRLEQNAYLDPESDVANTAAFEQVLDREWQRALRYRRPLGLLLLEVEQRGAGGIRLLGESDAKVAAEDIGREVRQSDTVAKLSPSRFAVICPEAPQGSAETLAHAIEHRLEERRLRCWVAFAERTATDTRPADLVARAAAGLAQTQYEQPAAEPAHEYPPADPALAGTGDRIAAA
jgi:GGDEF domain-containing protein